MKHWSSALVNIRAVHQKGALSPVWDFQMRTYQVGTSKFEIHAPRHTHVESVYANKQLQTKLSEYEEYNRKMRKGIE